MDSTERLIRGYYAAFNERRLSEAAGLFADDAVLEQLPRQHQLRGGPGYLQFANAWLAAFPDGTFTAQRVAPRSNRTHEIALLFTGTHLGALEFGGWVFKPTNGKAVLRLRELLEVRADQLAYSSVSFDLQEMIEQLTRVDHSRLVEHIGHLRQLGDELTSAQGDATRTRDVVDRLGLELDAARHVVRPYFRR